MSATGKSTVVRELARRGYKAIDADDGLTEPLLDGRQRWREEAVAALLDADDVPIVFLAGCEDNIVGFLPRFDRIILLSAPVETLLERLATRPNNPFGKRPGELARVLRDRRPRDRHHRADRRGRRRGAARLAPGRRPRVTARPCALRGFVSAAP
jgi:shikimate kinase